MPLRLEIKKKLNGRSERVKCVDFHPVEPWILSALFSGHVFIWNYQTQSLLKTLEVGELPVRACRFVPTKQWIVCACDDMNIRVFNYNTMQKVKAFEAHTDYIRSIAIHPTQPFLLSASDDTTIKMWDWDKDWQLTRIFEGHTHYVMAIEFNPKDPNTFASASLDRTIKVWGITSSDPHFSMEGHDSGVNCVSYYRGGDKPYMISGGDDHLVKVWDYQTKACMATLDGHSHNISSVMFHPELPIIMSASEDGTVRIWHSSTYRLENTLNYNMERAWTLAALKGSNKVAIGFDDGTIMIKIGHEEPVSSMERGGKIVWANNHEIVLASVKAPAGSAVPVDGESIQLKTKELGSCELYPQYLQHDPKGHFICACGDGEYIIYTALSLKNKSFGSALEFCWANDSGCYATRESASKVKVFKDFKEHKAFRPNFAAEGIFGGALLGVRSNDFVDFYDWNECKIIRRIDVTPRKVFWSENGSVVVLAADAAFYVLRYNDELVAKFAEQGVEVGEQGIEGAFELEQEVAEKVKNGVFVGDLFIYTNTLGRLNYYVGGEVMTLAHLAKPLHLLGYLPKENRCYLMDKSHNMYSYSLLLNVLIYQTAIVRRDFESAKSALKQIPQSEFNKLARFLESQDLKELALEVSQDPEHRFELAMQCKKLAFARSIAMESESEQKWKQLGDAALNVEFDIKMAEECYLKALDFSSLLMLYTSVGNQKGMENLAKLAKHHQKSNIAFLCLFLLHRVDEAIQLLVDTDRIAEAAFMTRTYAPTHISNILSLWRQNLASVSTKAAEALADPLNNPEKFPDLKEAEAVEEFLRGDGEMRLKSANQYPSLENFMNRNLIQEFREGKIKTESNSQKKGGEEKEKENEREKEKAKAKEKEKEKEMEKEKAKPPAPSAAPSPLPVSFEKAAPVANSHAPQSATSPSSSNSSIPSASASTSKPAVAAVPSPSSSPTPASSNSAPSPNPSTPSASSPPRDEFDEMDFGEEEKHQPAAIAPKASPQPKQAAKAGAVSTPSPSPSPPPSSAPQSSPKSSNPTSSSSSAPPPSSTKKVSTLDEFDDLDELTAELDAESTAAVASLSARKTANSTPAKDKKDKDKDRDGSSKLKVTASPTSIEDIDKSLAEFEDFE